MRRLARAFAGRLCDKYHHLMSWLKCVFNISELSNNHKILELCSYDLPRFLGRVEKRFQQWLHRTHPSHMVANNILWVTNPIKDSYKRIWLVAFDMGLSEPYWKSSVDGQISACCQSTFKMGQFMTLKLQSLLYILHLGHILDTLGHFIGIIGITGCKRYPARKRKIIVFYYKYTRSPIHA